MPDRNTPDAERAREIAQDFLDRQGEATVAGDIEATLGFCDLPCTLESLETRKVVTSAAEMRAICVEFIEHLRRNRVSHMVRRCLSASLKADGTLWAAYETRYVHEGNVLSEDPYAGFIILRDTADGWKIATMQFAVDADSPAPATLRNLALPPE